MSLFRQFPQPQLTDADVQLCERWKADPGMPGSIAKACLRLGVMTARQRAVLWDADGGGFRARRGRRGHDPYADLDFDEEHDADLRECFGRDWGDL
jgi:hypothetical protein